MPDEPSLHVNFGVVPTTWHDIVQAVVAHLQNESGGPGDQAIRLDTRAPVQLSENRRTGSTSRSKTPCSTLIWSRYSNSLSVNGRP